ncbi:MAG TPA: hypothetical protein VJ911_00255, partial [Cryomorphaceae bacterium]|nr:hypothetical protein [Cryomorphaceae bacterium]
QGSTKTFHNLIIDKDTDTRFAAIQTNSASVAMEVQGSLFIERGFLENNNRTIHVRGNITNRSKIGSGIGSTGDVVMNGSTGEQRIISQSGVFHGLNINNPDGVRLQNDGITIKRRLAISDGVFFIGDYKLRMETTFTPFVSTNSGRFVASSGNASAGGVEVLFHSGSQNTTFPIGVVDGENLKYTPAVTVVNGSFVDSGYVRIAPVDTLLSTADLTAGEPYLNYYWRVSHTDFDNPPSISHRFQFLYEDTVGTASGLGSGRVLADAPFSRETDDSPTSAQAHVDVGNRYIFYNGTDVAGNSSGNGTTLVNASYSAGDPNRFTGAPTILFSRSPNTTADWTNNSSWNNYNEIGAGQPLRDYHSAALTASTVAPGPGDIVYIGYNVDTDNKPHSYAAPSLGIQAAEVRFTPMEDNGGNKLPRYNGGSPSDITLLRPTLRLSSTSELGDVKQISGEGALLLQEDINLSVADIGGFLNADSSIVIVQSPSGILQMNSIPANVPNLFITSSSNGSDNRGVSINNDIVIRGDLEIAGNANLWLSSGALGNITVNGDLKAQKYQASTAGAQINFPDVGAPKSLIVNGDLFLSESNGKIEILGSSLTPPPSTPWTPDELGALLWLDADDASTVTESGGFVTQWNNKAGGSYNAVQSVSGQRPVYQASGLNGKNTMRFDGTDDFLRIAHNNVFNIPANQDFELFTVITPQQKDSRAIFAKGGVHSTDLTLYYWSNSYRLRFQGATFSVSTNTGNNTDPNIGWVRREGPNGYVWNTSGGNGSTSGVANAVVSNTKDVTIGTFDEGTDGRFFDGDIAEVILVKRALNTDERERLEGFLAHKWGLTAELPAGHPYKDAAPTSSQDNTGSHQLEVKGDIV